MKVETKFDVGDRVFFRSYDKNKQEITGAEVSGISIRDGGVIYNVRYANGIEDDSFLAEKNLYGTPEAVRDLILASVRDDLEESVKWHNRKEANND